MAKRRKSLASISQEQAHQALTFLVHNGKLALSTVEKALRNRERLIREIRERMVALGVGGFGLVERANRGAAAAVRAAGRATRKIRAARRAVQPTRRSPRPVRKRVSPARKAAMVRQGKYLAAIRSLSAQNRAKVKAVLTAKGWSAAMAEARRIAK